MPSYSSTQFYQDWRYSVKKDFTSPSGEPVRYAHKGFRTWGSEVKKIPFPKSPSGAAVNCDNSLIAISVQDELYVYDTVSFAEVLICKGHASEIESFAFQPGNPKVLISSASPQNRKFQPVDPTIIIWDLDEEKSNPIMEQSDILKIASQATETIIKNLRQAQPQLEISTQEEDTLTSSIEPEISQIIKNHKVAKQRTLHGSTMSHSKSQIFSPSGSNFIYLPGQQPRSNGNEAWDLRIHSMSTREDTITLTGHTDALLWSGYSPDESMIGTVAWDESMRIWDAATGNQKYKFTTKGQNWRGRFSPDSQKFAGTCGDGSLYIYCLNDGTMLIHHRPDIPGWMRALDWAPDSNLLAVGEGQGNVPARFILYDVEKQAVVQERILSGRACPIEPEYQSIAASFLECQQTRFVDEGRKVIVLTSGDGGIETYDLKNWEKWRFVRPGIDPEIGNGTEGSEEGSGGSGNEQQQDIGADAARLGGYSMAVWEDQKKGKVWIASVDGDAVRIWDLPLTRNDESAA